MFAKIQQDTHRRNEKRTRKKFATFVSETITSNKFNLRVPMKIVKLHVWSSSAIAVKVKDGSKMIELREDRALFARLLVISKAREMSSL